MHKAHIRAPGQPRAQPGARAIELALGLDNPGYWPPLGSAPGKARGSDVQPDQRGEHPSSGKPFLGNPTSLSMGAEAPPGALKCLAPPAISAGGVRGVRGLAVLRVPETSGLREFS